MTNHTPDPSRRERKRYVPFTVRYFRYLWRYKLTPAGRFLFWSVLFTSAGLATVLIPVYQMFCVLISSYLVVWFVNLLYRPKLTTIGTLPRRITAGEELRVEFLVTNLSWRPVYDLMFWLTGLPRSIRQESADVVVARLGAGETVTMPLLLRPLKRGVYDLPDLRPHSTFPFNLMRSGSTRVPIGSLIVVPSFHPIGSLDLPVGLRYQPGGIAMTSNVGESPEYIGNRDYVPGESTRRLDFRGWARLARPVVREYQEEYYCRVALILDTWLPARRVSSRQSQQLEAAVSLVAAVSDALSGMEYLLDLFAAGSELYVFRAGRQLSSFDSVLEILATVEHCRSDPFQIIAPAVADQLGSISAAVCVFLDWDESRAEVARAIQEAGCQLKVVIVRESPPTLPLPEELFDVITVTPAMITSGGIERL